MRIIQATLYVLSLFFVSSCVTHQDLVNYQEGYANSIDVEIQNYPELKIQANDVVRIIVHSNNLETAAPFNFFSPNEGDGFFNIESMQLGGYLVSPQGTIDFPVLGELKVQGKTVPQIKEMINSLLMEHLKDPVVNVRLLNFRVTVSGEVRNPGTFNIINERISILDALALAGDLTGHANRTNVLLVRENGGNRTKIRLNLQSADIFKSEYYYMQQNDLLYVEPIRAKAGAVDDQTSKTTPIVGVVASFVAVIVALVK